MLIRQKKSYFIALFSFLAVCWVSLTLFVQLRQPEYTRYLGDPQATRSLLVLFHPDPFYPFDERLGISASKAFVSAGWKATLVSYALAEPFKPSGYDLILLISNTYNWAPDWPTQDWIQSHSLRDKPVFLFSLGMGSTERSQRLLEKEIEDSGARILGSRSFWVFRPNDETRNDLSNIRIAESQAFQFSRQILEKMEN